MKKLLSAVITLFLLFTLCGCTKTEKAETFGVWWWNSDLSDQYLQFAQDNGVTEIYYCDSAFDEGTLHFIKSASKRKIKVYWLAGEYQWIYDSTPLYKKIERFTAFQNANAGNNFAGVHLDIEPHQAPDFSENRAMLLEKLVSLVYNLSVDYPDIKFDYDIPFWIDDGITFNGTTLPAYAHIINYSHRTFLMSYRDTAEAIYATAKDEIEYAKSVGKTVILGVETYSEEGNMVSFMEEGKKYMYDEIAKLKTMIPKSFGVSVHQIKTWYDLKD